MPNQSTTEADKLFRQFGNQEQALRQIVGGIITQMQGQVDEATAEISKLRAENEALRKEQSAIPGTEAAGLTAVLEAIRGLTPMSSDPKADARVPDTFKEEATKVEPLLMAARTYFSLKPRSCPDDRARIIWVLQFFVDRAEPWARGKLELFHNAERLDPYPSYTAFENDVRVTFSSVSRSAEARNAVLSMQPRSRETLGEFLNRLLPEADASNLGDVALIHRLRQCLPESVQTPVIMLKGGQEPKEITE